MHERGCTNGVARTGLHERARVNGPGEQTILMKTPSAILVVVLGAGPALASSVPVAIEQPALAGGITLAAGAETITHEVVDGVGVVLTAIAADASMFDGASGGGFTGEAIAAGLGSGLPGLGAGPTEPMVGWPVPTMQPKGDGGGEVGGILVPLPGAGLMGFAGLGLMAATSRRRRF